MEKKKNNTDTIVDIENKIDDQQNKTKKDKQAKSEKRKQDNLIANQRKQHKKQQSAENKQKLKYNKAKVQLRKKHKAQSRLSKERINKRVQLRQQYLASDGYKIIQLARQQQAVKRWYKLDNAALMYPITATNESNSVFRIGVQLVDPVDAVALQQAINDVFVRYPTMTGTIKNGVFWPYIDKPTLPLVATKDAQLPCRPMILNGKAPQTRVLYNNKEIACEYFHSATDGTGGLQFLNTLLVAYFDKIGQTITDTTGARHYRDKPRIEEITDQFTTIAIKKNPPPLPKAIKTCRIKGTTLPNNLMQTKRGICDSTQLYKIAKSYNGTVTELLGAVQLLSIAEHNRQTNSCDKHPIRLMIPVNLRPRYNLDTMRNFTSYIFYQYNGQSDIAEIVADIHNQAQQQMNNDYFTAMVSYNYNSGNNVLLKIVPLAVKRLAMKAVMTQLGEGMVNCAVLSNLGVVKPPEQFAGKVDRYDFQLGRGYKNIFNYAVATYNNTCVISTVSSLYEDICEKHFFRTLASIGVDLAIEADILEGVE